MAEMEYFSTYEETEELIKKLSDEEAGMIYKAQYAYSFHDEITDFSSDERLSLAWPMFFAKIKRDKHKKYVTSAANAFKTFKRDNKDSNFDHVAWWRWKKCQLRDEPDSFIHKVTLQDMEALDAKSSKKSSRNQRESDDYAGYPQESDDNSGYQ